MIDSVVFDLDGTLWDTCPTCALGWNNVLRRHGIAFREITAEDIRTVTGRPHAECIREVVGDTTGDQSAARECAVPFVYVDYGFGRCHDVDRRFSSFEALTDWLLFEGAKPTGGQ